MVGTSAVYPKFVLNCVSGKTNGNTVKERK